MWVDNAGEGGYFFFKFWILKIHLEMEWVDLWQLLLLKTVMVGHGGSSAGSYLADPTSPIPSHFAVIILFVSVSVHQLLWLAL